MAQFTGHNQFTAGEEHNQYLQYVTVFQMFSMFVVKYQNISHISHVQSTLIDGYEVHPEVYCHNFSPLLFRM